MEMPEGPNRPPKPLKIEETLEHDHENGEEEEDRFSALPDCLILHILSRLPSTEDAVKTGTLSKRWKSLWTSLPILVFKQKLGMWNRLLARGPYFISFVNRTLTQCSHNKLNEFRLFVEYDTQLQSQINNWICYAMSRNVEQLDLAVYNSDTRVKCVLDEPFFVNSCFTYLKLDSFLLNPKGAISWKMLKSLCIIEAKLDEDLIQNILSGCPALETLVLSFCHGYKRLDITSKSVKSLVIFGYKNPKSDDDEYDDDIDDDDDADVIKINAPYILSLKIMSYLSLWKLSLLDVSSLVTAELDYKKLGYFETTQKEAKEEMMKGFIESLRRVKELKVGISCSKVAGRLEAKGLSYPSNMRFCDVALPWCFDSDTFVSEGYLE